MTPDRCFEIRAAASGDAEIMMFDGIGYGGIDAKSFAEKLGSVKSGRNVTLRINSPGGSVIHGSAIFNAISRFPGKVTAQIDGLCASCATYIACACSTVRIAENALFMVHMPTGGGADDAEGLRKGADLLDNITANYVAVYVKRTGKTAPEITEAMKKESWWNGTEAKTYGWADAVTDKIEATACFDLSGFKNAPVRVSGTGALIHATARLDRAAERQDAAKEAAAALVETYHRLPGLERAAFLHSKKDDLRAAYALINKIP